MPRAHASSGAANSASLMKDTQVASGFLQFSRTVPVSDVNLVPHARHLHRWSPDAEAPSRRAPPSPHSGQAGSGLYSSAASAERAEAELLAEPALLDVFFQ